MWQYGLEECGPVALSQELPLVPGGERRLGGICMTPLEVMTCGSSGLHSTQPRRLQEWERIGRPEKWDSPAGWASPAGDRLPELLFQPHSLLAERAERPTWRTANAPQMSVETMNMCLTE